MTSRYCDGITRRDMLQVGFLGITGLTTSNFLRMASAATGKKTTADAVLFLNLAGGPAHLDTLDMKPDGKSEQAGEFKPIQSKVAGLHVCELLPKITAATDQFTLIRGISHTAGSHPQGQSYISTGNRPSPALIYPSLGSGASYAELDELITSVYLRTLARPPQPAEHKRSLLALNQAPNAVEGLRDVMWALLNTQEFLTNH